MLGSSSFVVSGARFRFVFLFRALGLSLFSVSGLEFVTSGAGIQFHYSVSCPGLKSDFPKMSPPFFKNPQVFSELLALTRNFLVRPSS